MKESVSRNRKTILVIFLILIFCIPSYAFARAEEEFHKTLQLNQDGKVYLKNVSGDVSITGWKENKVQINALKVARHKKHLDGVSIDIHRTNGTVRISTNYHPGARNVSVHYDLFVPEKASVRGITVSGDVEAQDIGGFLSLETVSGDVTIARGLGGVKGKTISGEIDLREVIGNADLRSVSGEITVHDLQGSVEAKTVSGDIVLKDVSRADEVVTETISGKIEYRGDLSDNGNYEFVSHSGDVVIDLPPESSFELQTKTLSGKVKCEFDLKMSGIINTRKIHGVVGKGGANMLGSSFSGDIRIKRQGKNKD